jgi:hypothetical protein
MSKINFPDGFQALETKEKSQNLKKYPFLKFRSFISKTVELFVLLEQLQQ